MKIAIYHPNMHLFGGGETVALTLASHLQKEHEITFFITKNVSKQSLEKYFCLDLSTVQLKVFGKLISFLPGIPSYKQSLQMRWCMHKLNKYDLVIDTCSNGLFYKKLEPKTLCYVHFPNYTKPKKGIKALFNKLLIKAEDMFVYDHILCNSKFTKQHVKKITHKDVQVVYPPVQTSKIVPNKKENIIMTIGRYSKEKKHEIIIESFKKLSEQIKGYQLQIVGSTADEEYFEMLQTLSRGKNIRLYKNVPHERVLRMLQKTKVYWHARGYGETNPVEYENFGITTVEALAAGCATFVINLGAQPEIVNNKQFVWNNPEELVAKTKKHLQKNPQYKPVFIRNIDIFSVNSFLKHFDELL